MNDLKSTHSETSTLVFIHWKLLETNMTANHDTFAATSRLVGGAAAAAGLFVLCYTVFGFFCSFCFLGFVFVFMNRSQNLAQV